MLAGVNTHSGAESTQVSPQASVTVSVIRAHSASHHVWLCSTTGLWGAENAHTCAGLKVTLVDVNVSDEYSRLAAAQPCGVVGRGLGVVVVMRAGKGLGAVVVMQGGWGLRAAGVLQAGPVTGVQHSMQLQGAFVTAHRAGKQSGSARLASASIAAGDEQRALGRRRLVGAGGLEVHWCEGVGALCASVMLNDNGRAKNRQVMSEQQHLMVLLLRHSYTGGEPCMGTLDKHLLQHRQSILTLTCDFVPSATIQPHEVEAASSCQPRASCQ